MPDEFGDQLALQALWTEKCLAVLQDAKDICIYGN